MQCHVWSSKEKIQPVPEFSYNLTGVFCLFLLSFLFTIFYSCTKIYAYYKEICSPWIKHFGAMTFQLKFALYLPHLKSFELIHFRRRLRYLVPLPWHILKVRRKTDGDTPSTWGGGWLFYCNPGGSNVLTSEETRRPSLQLLSVWNGFAWVALMSF